MNIQSIVNEAKKEIEDFKKNNSNWVVIIRGATATGKTKLSILLSKFFDIEIISADSRQIFKYMNIGTDTISSKYTDIIPHHLVNIIKPDEIYTAWQRKKECEQHIDNILSKNKLPIIIWWTWLYIDTIYKNFTIPECSPNKKFREEMYQKEEEIPWFLHRKLQKIDPTQAQKIHPNSTRYLVRALEIYHETWLTKTEACKEQAVTHPLLMIGLRRNKESTNQLIDNRIKQMLKDNKLINEVQWLIDKWYSIQLQSMQGIGYKEVANYIQKHKNKEQLEEDMKKNTHKLAKKQRTRFRRYINDANNNPKKNVKYKIFELE